TRPRNPDFPACLTRSAGIDPGASVARSAGVEHALIASPMDTSQVRIERVLCAVTFSPSARQVVAWAASLAGAHDADGEVRLFHTLPHSDPRSPVAADVDSAGVLRKLFALARHLPRRPRVSAAVTAGETVGEIVRHARLCRADVIAIGMHGEDGNVSSLVTRLAIDAPCPVLVVDERSAAPATREALDRILVAVDFLP